MSGGSWAIWGFVATVMLTTILSGSQGLGLTRMNVPFLLGSLITPDRSRAKVYGIAIHLVNGWVFSLLYVAAFHSWGVWSAWRGAAVGVVHALFVLVFGLPLLPSVHPRMASETTGPDTTRQLEPPGFLGLHYGWRTPFSIVLAHAVYGAILGAFYAAPGGAAAVTP